MTTKLEELREHARLCKSKPTIANKYDNAADKIASFVAYLTDETSITEDWLRPLCVRVSDKGSYWTLLDNNDLSVYLVRWNGGWSLRIGGIPVTSKATRGDVARVLFALSTEKG